MQYVVSVDLMDSMDPGLQVKLEDPGGPRGPSGPFGPGGLFKCSNCNGPTDMLQGLKIWGGELYMWAKNLGEGGEQYWWKQNLGVAYAPLPPTCNMPGLGSSM